MTIASKKSVTMNHKLNVYERKSPEIWCHILTPVCIPAESGTGHLATTMLEQIVTSNQPCHVTHMTGREALTFMRHPTASFIVFWSTTILFTRYTCTYALLIGKYRWLYEISQHTLGIKSPLLFSISTHCTENSLSTALQLVWQTSHIFSDTPTEFPSSTISNLFSNIIFISSQRVWKFCINS